MTYEMIDLTRQAATSHWGWTIAFFLWFVGLAGMGLFLNYWLKSKRVFFICTVSAILGTLLVVSHLARMLNLPMAVINSLLEWKFNFTSWMFIGICILSVLCIATVVVSWLLSKGRDELLSGPPALFNAALGVAATAYSGFLLTQAAGVPLWNTAALPVLWIASGLACAVGLVEVLTAANRLEGGHRSWVPTTATLVHIGEAFVLFAFVQAAFFGTPGANAGANALWSGSEAMLFWGGAVGLGIVVPMILSAVKNHTAALAGGVCALVGALCLRASVLFAGYFEPIIF